MVSIRFAVDAAIDSAPLDARDVAAQQLAREYADAIDDDPDRLSDMGPKLLATLAALGLTPTARGATKGGDGGSPVASRLDELRARRKRRDTG